VYCSRDSLVNARFVATMMQKKFAALPRAKTTTTTTTTVIIYCDGSDG
jgi:hypothetical protein